MLSFGETRIRFKQWRKDNRHWLIAIIVLLLLVILFPVIMFVRAAVVPDKKASATPTPTLSTSVGVPDRLGEFKAPNGDIIGVNDGSYPPFDSWHDKQELNLKQQASVALHNGDRAGAGSLWRSALKLDSSDAEALIYLENQHVLESGKPYITLVVGVDFVNADDPSAQRQLQGVYVAQHEYNAGSSAFDLRILIAASGHEVTYVNMIAHQIAQIADKDKTVVGMIGWLTSSRSHEALSTLAGAKIPQVSPQASDDGLTHASPYFFRVVPPNKVQAREAAQFAEQTLKVKNPVVFLDPKDNYSQNLAQDFEDQFVKDGYPRPHEETFMTDKNANFFSLIQDAKKYNPDAFYFTSASNGDTGSFQDALPTSGPLAGIPVVSGDAGYVAHKNSYNRWYFTDFAYPDEWSLVVRKDYPPFFQDYSADFNPDGQKPGGYYGYSRADDHAILSYDAASVLLAGVQQALAQGKTMPTAQDVANALPQITGDQAFQGVSGQIAFDTNHDPANKAVVFLYTSADGHLQMKSVQGCFIKGCP